MGFILSGHSCALLQVINVVRPTTPLLSFRRNKSLPGIVITIEIKVQLQFKDKLLLFITISRHELISQCTSNKHRIHE